MRGEDLGSAQSCTFILVGRKNPIELQISRSQWPTNRAVEPNEHSLLEPTKSKYCTQTEKRAHEPCFQTFLIRSNVIPQDLRSIGAGGETPTTTNSQHAQEGNRKRLALKLENRLRVTQSTPIDQLSKPHHTPHQLSRLRTRQKRLSLLIIGTK